MTPGDASPFKCWHGLRECRECRAGVDMAMQLMTLVGSYQRVNGGGRRLFFVARLDSDGPFGRRGDYFAFTAPVPPTCEVTP